MYELQIFSNAELGSVRTVTVDNEPYFVGKDVAEILGYSNTRDALAKRVDDEDKLDGGSNLRLHRQRAETGLNQLKRSVQPYPFKQTIGCKEVQALGNIRSTPCYTQTRYVCYRRFDCQSRYCHRSIYGFETRAREI